MNQSMTFPTASLEHPAMDYTFLCQDGIRRLERMAGSKMSDIEDRQRQRQ